MADGKSAQRTANEGNWLVRNVRFIIKNRLYGFIYFRQLYRFVKFKLFHPGIKTEGFVFLPRKYDIGKGKNAKFTIGAWVWIGSGCAFRAHEGHLSIGRKTTFGGNNTINCYQRVDIKEECLFADNIYVVDFDHWYLDPNMSIRSQGIRKEDIVMGPNVWVAEKATILRGDRGDEPRDPRCPPLRGRRRCPREDNQVPQEPGRCRLGRGEMRCPSSGRIQLRAPG